MKRNLSRLIDQGHLGQAMELSLELMKEGSCQVEMSDEGLMTSDIEERFSVVVQALKKSKMPPGEVIAWCKAMTKSDRVGFIYEREAFAAIAQIREVAQELGQPMGRLSVAWLLAQPGVTAAVVGARNTAQAIENAAAAELILSSDMIARLSEITRPLKEILGANADPWEHVSRMDRPS